MTELKAEYLGELPRLDVRPGDKFVLMVPDIISAEEARCMRRIWAEFMGGDEKQILVLGRGIEVGVIRQEQEAA